MRAIIIDDEPLMLSQFQLLSAGIPDLTVVGQFCRGSEAVEFLKKNEAEIVFLDVMMPDMNGIECAKKIKAFLPDILTVFISAYDRYVRECNEIGGDYYIVKPCSQEILEMTVEKMKLLQKRQRKSVFIQTFGRFSVLKDGIPAKLTGKAKEILALIVSRRGREISNEELYSTIWEDRPYSNKAMKVYYNALTRLREALEENGLSGLVISSGRGQRANTELFDCDYYDMLDSNMKDSDKFSGEFLSEYSWGEYILGDILEWYRRNDAKEQKKEQEQKTDAVRV
ncbi:MAG: response regulator [Lachnospiraceae bacterium]|nr:response regulator [Lachnospiraceae bacterium]